MKESEERVMFTILLVDDEPATLESLTLSVPWSNFGINTILTAHDGMEALSILHNTNIDLLITDIRMPQMDGITLLTEIRRTQPELHCIFLSAYSEFEYAFQAMRLGVDNYLMKPLAIEELCDSVEAALDNIYTNRKNIETLFQENIIRRWVTGKISPDELAERASILGLNVYHNWYCTVVIQKYTNTLSFPTYSEMFSSTYASELRCVSFCDTENRYVLLISDCNFTQQQIAEKLDYVSKKLNIEDCLDIAIGEIVSDRNSVSRSYQSACQILDTQTQAERKSGNILLCQTEPFLSNSINMLSNTEYSPIVARAIAHIEENYSNGISLKEFCQLLNINASYLGYLFKKETGTYFNNYLTDYRTSKAIELLLNSGKKIGDIAAMTGYISTSHFISTFKKKTGISPLKYRELYAGK